MRDPASAAPPIPWEDKSVAWPMRFVGTLANAARPRTSAPALAREGVAPAIVFALLTFPPLAALAGIVPATRTLLFGEGRIQLVGDGSGADIALDVARAAGIGLVACTILLLALALTATALAETARPDSTAMLAPLMPVTRVSFGIYLLHPVMEFVFLTVIWQRVLEPLGIIDFYVYWTLPMVATVAVAMLSDRFVERRFGGWIAGPRRPEGKPARMASA